MEITIVSAFHVPLYNHNKNMSLFKLKCHVLFHAWIQTNFFSDVDSWSDNFQYCVDFCAYHSFDQTTELKFAFIGNPDSVTCDGCVNRVISPNGNPGLDSVIGKYS
jgi:hypothetical protein